MDQMNKLNFPTDVSHINGEFVPNIVLAASDGTDINLREIPGKVVVFIQPGSSTATETVDGWVDEIINIPGAAGCTGQCSAFSTLANKHPDLKVFGLSGQSVEELSAVVDKLELPYQMLSDVSCQFLNALGLRQIFYKAFDGLGNQGYHPRVLLLIENGVINSAVVPELTPEGAFEIAEGTSRILTEIKLMEQPFPRFCDDLLDAVRAINKRQLALVQDTLLENMGINESNLGKFVDELNHICSVSIPEDEARTWRNCNDVCESLSKFDATPSWKKEM